ncbi:MAG: hypothetical protein HY926_12730 [Elusimicrobia bacterium]|nr:hypothetical protein [Elusimicrobiota bacterium]
MARSLWPALLILSLPAAAWAGALAELKAEAPAADDKVKLVQAFLDMPTAELPADLVPEFLAVDPATLPEKLREPFAAKRLELYALKQIVGGKKRGAVRMPEENCAIEKEAKADSARILMMAGFGPITEDEERFVMDKTNCTERDLMCEFSLQIVGVKAAKKKPAHRLLFLHLRDPLMALVGQYREMGRVKQTNFFGIGGPVCAPRLK